VPDWLCASISALMVCGEICVQALPGPEREVVAVPEPCAPAERSNGLLAAWLWPAELVEEDELDAVSDCRLSQIEETAPSANIMALLRTYAAASGPHHSPQR